VTRSGLSPPVEARPQRDFDDAIFIGELAPHVKLTLPSRRPFKSPEACPLFYASTRVSNGTPVPLRPFKSHEGRSADSHRLCVPRTCFRGLKGLRRTFSASRTLSTSVRFSLSTPPRFANLLAASITRAISSYSPRGDSRRLTVCFGNDHQ